VTNETELDAHDDTVDTREENRRERFESCGHQKFGE